MIVSRFIVMRIHSDGTIHPGIVDNDGKVKLFMNDAVAEGEMFRQLPNMTPENGPPTCFIQQVYQSIP